MGTPLGSRPHSKRLNLSDPADLRRFLDRHDVAPDKGLGQHFLCSSKVVSQIVDAVGDVASVVEIGPGPGTLTQALVARWPVLAIEADARMASALRESAPSAQVLIADALRLDLAHELKQMKAPVAVVSNMPYNITGPLLGRIADAQHSWIVAVLMMQREVGEKILAPPGDSARGALSVRMQFEFLIHRVCLVPPGAFLPPPKVDSIVLKLLPKGLTMPEPLVRLVRAGFTQPRKTLQNNLRSAGFPRELVERAGLRPSIRPHEVTQEEWLRVLEAAS